VYKLTGFWTRPAAKPKKAKLASVASGSTASAVSDSSASRPNTSSTSSSTSPSRNEKKDGTLLERSDLEYLGFKTGGKILNSKRDLGILSKPKQQASKKKKERMGMVEGPVTERIHSIRRWWHLRVKRLGYRKGVVHEGVDENGGDKCWHISIYQCCV
jgi:hypothetical protein